MQGLKKLAGGNTELTIRRKDIGDIRLCTSDRDTCHETIAPWGERIDEITFDSVQSHATLAKAKK